MSQPAESDLVLSAAERAALGPFRSFHPAASGMHKLNIIIASVFTVLPLGAAAWFLIEALRRPGKGMEIGAALFAALALGPAIGAVYLLLKLSWKLYLFENGFVLARGSGRTVLWQDVQSFYEKQDVLAGMRADHWLRFLLTDGRRLTVDSSYKDFPAFAGAVRAALTRAVVTRAAEELRAGRPVSFGKLLLTSAGLQKSGDALAWDEVAGIHIEPRIDGRVHAYAVVVYKRGGPKDKVEWYKKMIPSFGNVDAFLRLAGQFTTITSPPGR
jgi:hypothetical protein